MAEEEVKLLGTWASPFSLRIELALNLKGIPYLFIEEDLSNKSPLLLKSNPVYKKTPVLTHHGKSISESLIILDYIDNTWKNNPLLPQDPYQRAMAYFWAKYIDEKVLPIAGKMYYVTEEDKNETLEELWKLLGVLENELNANENDLFWGETIGYVDIAGIFIGFWFEVLHEVVGKELLQEERFPFLNKWFKKLFENEEVSGSLPPRQEHISCVRSRFEAKIAAAAAAALK